MAPPGGQLAGPALPWSAVLDVDGPPIEALPDEFDGLATFFTNLAETTELVATSFTNLVNDSEAEFEGETADAFRSMTGDIGTRLGEVPERARTVSSIFRTHHDDLVALREEANAALARANTRWNEVQTAETSATNARSQRNRLQYQLDNFDTVVCGSEDHRVQVQLDLDDARSRASNADANLETARDELQRSKDEWDGLRDDHDALDFATGRALDDVRLGDLSDPGLFSQAWSAVSGFVVNLATDLVTGVWDFAVGLATGDWERALWGLSRALGAITTALSIVALFTPLAPFAAGVLLGGAITKLAVDSILFATDSVDPRTGNTIGVMDLALGTLTVAGAGAARFSAAPAQGAIPALVTGGGRGGGQLGRTAVGLSQGTQQTAIAVQTAVTPTIAVTSGARTFGTAVVGVADDGIQAASTIGTIYDVGWEGESLASNWHASGFDGDVDVVTGQGHATFDGPLVDQITGLDAEPIGASNTYGTIILTEADSDD